MDSMESINLLLIREWSPDREKMGKGVTLSEEELKELKKLLYELE